MTAEQIEGDLEEVFNKDLQLDLTGNTAQAAPQMARTASAPRVRRRVTRPVMARDSDFGSNIIYCDIGYMFSDGNGQFYVQRACGVRSAPWGYKLSSTVRELCTSYVTELGMQWTKNGVVQPAGASHLVPDNYTFHGTFSGHGGTGKGDNVNYHDQFACRHSLGGGGNVSLDLYGTLRFGGQW